LSYEYTISSSREFWIWQNDYCDCDLYFCSQTEKVESISGIGRLSAWRDMRLIAVEKSFDKHEWDCILFKWVCSVRPFPTLGCTTPITRMGSHVDYSITIARWILFCFLLMVSKLLYLISCNHFDIVWCTVCHLLIVAKYSSQSLSQNACLLFYCWNACQ